MQEGKKKRWDRGEVAERLVEVDAESQAGHSQRHYAEEWGIPLSTLQHWLSRRECIDADPAVIAFFESPTGVTFLHRLVLAAQFVITLLGGGGIGLVCMFLELSGLAAFVAASYGAQQKVTVAMEKAVVAFGQEERARLARDMAVKQITVCEDETFHPQVCLVAIEPVSDYILLEQYAADRQAATWTSALQKAIAGLGVEIIQATGDEGKGLLRHVEADLGAHHSPDLFHVQHELVKGVSGALASKLRKAERLASEVQEKVKRLPKVSAAAQENTPAVSTRPAEVLVQQQSARQAVEVASAQRERVQQAIRSIGRVYHPYDLETGAERSAPELSTVLDKHLAEIAAVAEQAQLAERAGQRIEKAKRVVPAMVATLAFYWLIVRAKIEALELTPQVEQAVYQHLLPGLYLHLVAEKAEPAAQKHALHKRSEELLAPLRTRDGPLSDLQTEEVALVERAALECVQLFQRSSSCVEGHNGQLALHHHRLHRISGQKLAALNTVHNYFVKRGDDTTAAERFFGAKPRDLFEWVLDRVDLPGRPPEKRPPPQRKGYLLAAASW